MTVSCFCNNCGCEFKRLSKNHSRFKGRGNIHSFCSRTCKAAFYSKSSKVICRQCSASFIRTNADLKRSKLDKLFCSRSCSATFNNTNKTHGTRRSKLEAWLEEQLTKAYPLEIHFNRKDTINSELDIYIPSLKLAFELNGIYHYEPIHGPEKLAAIQTNDHRKFQACLEKGIELCIIDTSGFKYFKNDKAKCYFDIIRKVIDSKS